MDRYIIVGIIILMLILLLFHWYKPDFREKFADAPILPNLQSCPADLKSFTTDKAVNCCEGTITGGICEGKAMCTLSNESGDLPRCIDWYKEYIDRMSQKHCMKSLPNFFEGLNLDKKTIIGRCTSSQLNNSLTQKRDTSAKECAIFKDNLLNEQTINSCYNERRLEKMTVPTPDAKRTISAFVPGLIDNMFLLSASYQDDFEPKTCVDRQSLYDCLDKLFKGWQNWPFFGEAQKQWEEKAFFCDTAKKRIEDKQKNPFYKSRLQKLKESTGGKLDNLITKTS